MTECLKASILSSTPQLRLKIVQLFFPSSEHRSVRLSWEHELKGKYHSTTDLLIILNGFGCFAYVELGTDLLVWLNPNQSNRGSAVQWHFPIWRVISSLRHIGRCEQLGTYLEHIRYSKHGPLIDPDVVSRAKRDWLSSHSEAEEAQTMLNLLLALWRTLKGWNYIVRTNNT